MSEYFKLTPEQVQTFGSCLWYMKCAWESGMRRSDEWTPGLPFTYVIDAMQAVGAIIRDDDRFNKRSVAPGLVKVHLWRDGSAKAFFDHGLIIETGPLPMCAQMITQLQYPEYFGLQHKAKASENPS